MFQYLLIDYYISWGKKFVLCRYPDFVGFQSGCEATEYAINWVCIKFSPLLFGNVDVASWAKNAECGNIGFSTMEYLIWCCMFECHCEGVIAYVVGVLMHLRPEAVWDAHVSEHCYCMLMGGVIISLGHSVLLLGIWCRDSKGYSLWVEPVMEVGVQELSSTIKLYGPDFVSSKCLEFSYQWDNLVFGVTLIFQKTLPSGLAAIIYDS